MQKSSFTSPEMMTYSQMNTTISGIMNFNTDGSNLIFRFNPSMNWFRLLFISVFGSVPYWVAAGVLFTFKFKSNSMVATDSFGGNFGDGRITQNVVASKTGITKNNSRVYCGLIPSAISDAYESEPNMPAPPVPDDHALITRLSIKKSIVIICSHSILTFKLTCCNRLMLIVTSPHPNPMPSKYKSHPEWLEIVILRMQSIGS